MFERQSTGNQPEYSLQMRRCSECFSQQRFGSQASVTAVKTVSQHKKYCLQLHSACTSSGQTHNFQSQRKVTCSCWGPKQRMPEWQILVAYMDRKSIVLIMTTCQTLLFPKCANSRNKLCRRWCLMLAWTVGTIGVVVLVRVWWQKIGILFFPLRFLVNSYRDNWNFAPDQNLV